MTRSLNVDQAMINKLAGIVLTNLQDENFGVEKLAKEAGMSRVTVHRKIKSFKGQSVSQFIREIRLQKAIKMLEDNEGNVAEIAFKVGFGSPTYFIKCFHDYYGFPPGEARYMKSGEPGDDQAFENSRTGYYKKPDLQTDIKSILKRNHHKNILLVSLGILSLFLIINFLFTPLEPQEKSIAVLPFRNESFDTINLYFINGIMDRITENLQKIRDLRVPSRNSVEKYRYNNTRSASEIARELGVNYILEGSSQRFGNSFSLVVQLIRARGKEKRLWTRSYYRNIREVEDYFKLESEIAQKIATELKAVISSEERQLIEIIPTASLTADDFYQRGREAYSKFWISENNSELKEAEDYYRKALEYDPVFAQAYAGLARIYGNKAYYNTYYSENFLDSVLVLCNLALSLNDKVEEAYIARGNYYLEKGPKDAATLDYKTAIDINPNSWEAYYNMPTEDFVERIENLYKAASINRGTELPAILKELAYVIGRKFGYPEQAKIYYQEALKLDGDSADYYQGLAGLERSQGNYFKDIEYLLKSCKLDSSDIFLYSSLGSTYGLTGQYKEALEYTKIYLDKQPYPLMPEINHESQRIGYAYWMNGDTTKGKYYFNKQIEGCLDQIALVRPGVDEGFVYYDLAGIYAFLGDKDQAFENLRKYNQNKIIYLGMLTWIKTDPLFDNIRDETEFRQIVRDQEAKYQTEHEKVRKWLEDNELL